MKTTFGFLISLSLAVAAFPATAQDISRQIAEQGLARTEAALAALPDPRPEDRFALGGVRFLRAIERSLQLRWRTGMNAARSELPLLRLPVPQNPTPDPFTPDLVTTLFTDAKADMAAAREALAPIGEADFGLEVTLSDLWFDVNMNGTRDEREGVIEIAGGALLGRAQRGDTASARATIRFDRADAAWLAAYTHFLSGFCDLVLAFHPEQPIARVLASRLAIAELQGDTPPPNALDYIFGQQVDRATMIYFALQQQPDPELTQDARREFLAMIAENRRFWALVGTETDNFAEWVPNDNQTSALGLNVPAGTGQHWLSVLDDAEAALNGDLLIPHWRFGGGAGINLRKLFENPAPIDIGAWAQGEGLLPYAEKGPRLTADHWREFQRLVGGRSMLFAVYLN